MSSKRRMRETADTYSAPSRKATPAGSRNPDAITLITASPVAPGGGSVSA